MKQSLFKVTIVWMLVAASLMLTQQAPVYAARSATPASYTLENIFNAEYGKEEEDVTAGILEPGDGMFLYPEIYAVTDNDDVYVVDTYSPKQHTPVKHFDCTGKYIRTISCELFTDNDILSMIAFGDMLYIRTSDDFLCCFNTKTDEVQKHSIEKVDGFNYYGMEMVENRVALIYEQEIEEEGYYELRFQTFDTDKQAFVPSDDIISVVTYKDDDKLRTKIKFSDFLLDMAQSMCNLPLGISKAGNLIIEHHGHTDDIYGEYDMNGNRIDQGYYNSMNHRFTQHIHMIRNEMTVYTEMSNADLYIPEYVICKVEPAEGFMTETAWLRMPMATACDDPDYGDPNLSDGYLTRYWDLAVSDPDAGPMHYTIMDSGDIFILDDMREDKPIKHYSKDGEYIETIYSHEFSGTDSGFLDLIACGDKLYVEPAMGDIYNNCLCEYDPVTKTIVKYPLHQNITQYNAYPRALIAVGKYLVFDSYGYEDPIWIFDTEKHEVTTDTAAYTRYYDMSAGRAVIKTDGREYFIPIPANGDVYPIGFDNEGNITVHYISDGISYRKYTPDGKLLAFAEEDYTDSAYYLNYPERVINGELIRARTTKEVYSLDKVVFNGDYFKNTYDINFDGSENVGDAVAVLRYCVELAELDSAQAAKADINGDCKVNTADAVAILRFSAGL